MQTGQTVIIIVKGRSFKMKSQQRDVLLCDQSQPLQSF